MEDYRHMPMPLLSHRHQRLWHCLCRAAGKPNVVKTDGVSQRKPHIEHNCYSYSLSAMVTAIVTSVAVYTTRLLWTGYSKWQEIRTSRRTMNKQSQVSAVKAAATSKVW